MKILKTLGSLASLLMLTAMFLNACGPVRNLTSAPNAWQGDNNFESRIPDYSPVNKNVFIIADAKMTVLFDMLAPFYLFNSTEKANVYIIAKDKTPILIKRDLFVRPQLTFDEADSMKLQADVIVIPALSKRDEHQDTVVVNWIKAHFSEQTKLLAICDGASTAAATGLYDGKPLTCHASDFDGLKLHFSKPDWVQNIAVTKSGNLYSTAGVSNAVEGSLVVINDMFGKETMENVLTNIYYPATEVKTTHNSIAVNNSHKFIVAKKIMFRKNRKIAVLIEDGVDEFEMASLIETYGRSLPASFTVFNLNASTITTKYGLTLINTEITAIKEIDELHLLKARTFSKEEELYFSKTQNISYDNRQDQYFINICLERIGKQYGNKFEDFVKVSLDYN